MRARRQGSGFRPSRVWFSPALWVLLLTVLYSEERLTPPSPAVVVLPTLCCFVQFLRQEEESDDGGSAEMVTGKRKRGDQPDALRFPAIPHSNALDSTDWGSGSSDIILNDPVCIDLDAGGSLSSDFNLKEFDPRGPVVTDVDFNFDCVPLDPECSKCLCPGCGVRCVECHRVLEAHASDATSEWHVLAIQSLSNCSFRVGGTLNAAEYLLEDDGTSLIISKRNAALVNFASPADGCQNPGANTGRAKEVDIYLEASLEAQRGDHNEAEPVEPLHPVGPSRPGENVEPSQPVECDGSLQSAHSIPSKYGGAYQYESVFAPLVELEADWHKRMIEARRKVDITVTWDMGLNGKHVAHFNFPQDDLRLVPGEKLKLTYAGDRSHSAWQSVGHVVEVTAQEEVAVELRANLGLPIDVRHDFSVELVWESTNFDRMKAAMNTLATNEASVSRYIYHRLLGNESELQTAGNNPPVLVVPGLPTLDSSQIFAVKSALKQPLSLIEGPPGTGKTIISAAIVYCLAKQNRNRVLACAPHDGAVDILAEKISATGLKVVRLCANSRKTVNFPVKHLTLAYQVRHMDITRTSELRNLQHLKEKQGYLSNIVKKKYKALKRAKQLDILREADVICCSCSGAYDPRLFGIGFHQVLIDDSTQATQPECIIPLMHGCNRVVLIGDMGQLGPAVKCQKAARAGLSESLFERLVRLGEKPIRLQVQHRMHPCLWEFPSYSFYAEKLRSGFTMHRKLPNEVNSLWPLPNRPMLFYVHKEKEEMSPTKVSYFNRGESGFVQQLVTTFVKHGVKPTQIGVITPFVAQRACILNYLARYGVNRGPHGSLWQEYFKDVQVATVDSFRGQEKDYIIFSCTSTMQHPGVSFLMDPLRLNVALTRARYGIAIVGNPGDLKNLPLGRSLLGYLKEHNCLVEGSMKLFKQSMVEI